MPTHVRTISNKSKTMPKWKPHLGKEKVKEIETEDVLLAVTKERAKARIGVIHGSANRQDSDALIPLVAEAVKRLQTLDPSVMLTVGVNVRIATRIAVAATLHLMMRIERNEMHMKQSAIVKERCPTRCLRSKSEDPN